MFVVPLASAAMAFSPGFHAPARHVPARPALDVHMRQPVGRREAMTTSFAALAAVVSFALPASAYAG
jgi:hypothetical protein